MVKSLQVPVLVAGSGRSGTTWIGDTLAACKGCCPVFEPLHPRRVGDVPKWGRCSALPGPYLRWEREHPEWKAFFTDVFSGRISNCWTRQDWTRVPEVFSWWRLAERTMYRVAKLRYQRQEKAATRYVVKEIRANLLLAWLDRHCPVDVLFVIRHPCAVVGSRLRLLADDEGWAMNTEEILTQPELMEDWLEPYRPTIAAANSPVEKQAVLWCVENFVPLRHARKRGWRVLSYEECLAGGAQVLQRVCRQLGLQWTDASQRACKRIVSNPGGTKSLDGPWHQPLSAGAGEEVLGICRAFGIELYGRQPMPLCALGDYLSLAHT